MPTTVDLERMLSGVALRATRPRVPVLSAAHDPPVHDMPRTRSAANLVGRFRHGLRGAQRGTGGGRPNHHVVCRSCRAIADVDCAMGYTACLMAVDDAGYEIDETEVIYWRPTSPVCRGNFCRVRRLVADRHARYQQSNTAWDLEQATSRATSRPNETARQEIDRRD